MKVKVPKTVKIAAHSYKPFFREHLREEENKNGYINFRTGELAIEPDQTQENLDISLYHEIVHTIDRIYCCEISETDTERIAQGLAEFLKNNLGVELDWSDIK